MPQSKAETDSGGPWGWWLLLLFLWALSLPLLGAFWVQFVWNEAPCPLCLLQRMCMILAGLGLIWILTGDGVTNRETNLATNRAVDRARWSQGFAIAVLAATLGLCIALRQVLLHIAPDAPGFGTPILGYHLYSWAFGIFIAMLLCSGISLLLTESLSVIDEAYKKLLLTRISLWVFGLLILANALVVSFTAARGLFPAE